MTKRLLERFRQKLAFGHPAGVRVLKQCSVLPVGIAYQDGKRDWLGGGIYDRNGSPLRGLEIQMKDQPELSTAVRHAATLVTGQALFCGIMKDHFGHFLAESLGRLWATQHYSPSMPLCFVSGDIHQLWAGPTAKAGLEYFGVSNPLILIRKPTRFDELLVPEEHFNPILRPGIATVARDWIAKRLPPPGNGPDLYVSRSEVSSDFGHFLHEKTIEAGLRSEGYEVFHPQLHSFADQIAAYRSAKRIVAAESSAVILMSLVCTVDTKVAIIQRRPHLPSGLRNAGPVFLSSEVGFISAFSGFWTSSNGTRRDDYRGVAELNLPYLWGELEKLGLIASGQGKLVPTDDEVSSELDMVRARFPFRFGLKPGEIYGQQPVQKTAGKPT